MATRTRQWACNKEQNVAVIGGTDYGNGNDKHAPVGMLNQGYNGGPVFNPARDLMAFALDWTNVVRITKAELWLYKSNAHVPYGGTPRVTASRINASWGEAGGSEGNWSTSPGTKGAGPSATGTGSSDSGGFSGGDGWTHFDITAIVEAWAPAGVLRSDGTAGGGQANQGIRLQSHNENDNTPTIEFVSRRGTSGQHPYIKLTFDDNHPPEVPVVQTPAPGQSPAIVGSTSGRDLVVEFTYADADGDLPAKVEMEAYGDAVTDTTPPSTANRVATTSPVAVGQKYGGNYRVTLTVPSANKRTLLRYRLRVQDAQGAWSVWTSLADGSFKTAYIVGVPSNPAMQTTPDSPHIGGSINSVDPQDYLTGWGGRFTRADQSGTVTLWSNPAVDIGGGTIGPPPSPTRSDIPYQGEVALRSGDVVNWQQWHFNRDGVKGAESPIYTTVVKDQVGPTITPADAGTKLTSRTAQLTITFEQSSDGYQWQLFRAGAVIYDSGIVAIGAAASVNVNIPAGVANWCDDLTISAATRPAGTAVLGPFSPQSKLHIDCLPSTTLGVSA